MKNSSRRSFIKEIVLAGAATFYLPGPGSFAAAANVSKKKKAVKGTVILFQGDSITDGNRGRNMDPNHIMGHGYAFGVASRLGADHPEKKIVFYNRGISGNKINDLARRWQEDTLDLKPDVLSILVGVNDSSSVVFQREPIISSERYEQEYDSLLKKTQLMYPEILFVLCEPFILKSGKVKDNWDIYQADIEKRQAIVKKLALKYNAVHVEFQKVFNKALDKAPAEYWIWDGVHPTVPGHELMAREWVKDVTKRLIF